MYLTGRFPLLLLLGVVPLVLAPRAAVLGGWLLGCVVALAVDVALAGSPSRVRVERRPVAPVRIGETSSSTLHVGLDRGRGTRLALRDAWQPSAGASGERHRTRVAPGRTRVLTTTLAPTRRGELHPAGVTLRVPGPLGLGGRQVTRPVPGAVRVLPSFDSRRHLPSRLARLRELDGRAAVRVRGQGTEFDSLREYVHGDDVRSIDWRASSRSRNVVVRTWQPERDRRIVLVLDTSRVQALRVGDGPRLDAAMEAALLLGTVAGRAGDRVDLVAGDRRVRARCRTAGREVAQVLSETMADLEPEITEADWPRLAAAVAGLGRQRALLVLLTGADPAPVMGGLLPVLPTLVRHHRVVVASVADPEVRQLADLDRVTDVAGAHLAAAAAEELTERDEVHRVLRGLGVHVVEETPEGLAPALTDHYLDLKARGLL